MHDKGHIRTHAQCISKYPFARQSYTNTYFHYIHIRNIQEIQKPIVTWKWATFLLHPMRLNLKIICINLFRNLKKTKWAGHVWSHSHARKHTGTHTYAHTRLHTHTYTQTCWTSWFWCVRGKRFTLYMEIVLLIITKIAKYIMFYYGYSL